VSAVTGRGEGGTALQLPPGGLPLQLLWLPDRDHDQAPPPTRAEVERALPIRVAAAVKALPSRRLRFLPPSDADPHPSRVLNAGDVCLIVDTHRQATGQGPLRFSACSTPWPIRETPAG